MTFPLTLKAAFGEEKYVFDGLGDWNLLADLEYSGDGQSGGRPLIHRLLHRRHVVREQNAPLPRGPFEHFRIAPAGQTSVLNAHDVQIGAAAQQAAEDAVVEVFVKRKAQHSGCVSKDNGSGKGEARLSARLPPAGQKAFAQALWVELCFDFFSQLLALYFSLLKILFDFGAVL